MVFGVTVGGTHNAGDPGRAQSKVLTRISGVSCMMALMRVERKSAWIYNIRNRYRYPIGREYMGVISPWIGNVRGQYPHETSLHRDSFPVESTYTRTTK